MPRISSLIFFAEMVGQGGDTSQVQDSQELRHLGGGGLLAGSQEQKARRTCLSNHG